MRSTMKHMLAFASLCAAALVHGQGTMNIHLVSDTTVLVDMAVIDSVSYQLMPPPPTMLVHQNGGTVDAFPVADIDSITYSPAGPVGAPQVATLTTIAVGSTGALCAGVVGAAGGSPVVARGICYGMAQLPDLGGSAVLASGITGPFQAQLAGLQPGATYYARAYATNANGTAYGNQIVITTLSASYLNPDLSYGSVTDQDGNTYATIVIGTQEWMAENLRTTTYANGDTIPNVIDGPQWGSLTTGAWAFYQNNSQFENPYGKLYNWYAVADPRNVCPTGWHVPTDADWQILETAQGMPFDELDIDGYRGDDQGVGGKLKCIGLQYWNTPNTGATNESGFSSLPGGGRNDGGGSFIFLGDLGLWWCATETDTDHAWSRTMFDGYQGIERDSNNTKRNGFSVRCLRD